MWENYQKDPKQARTADAEEGNAGRENGFFISLHDADRDIHCALDKFKQKCELHALLCQVNDEGIGCEDAQNHGCQEINDYAD